MVATVTASYFLLTADYGPEPNVLDPVSIFYSLLLFRFQRPIFGFSIFSYLLQPRIRVVLFFVGFHQFGGLGSTFIFSVDNYNK